MKKRKQNPIKENLEEVFQELLPDEDAPAELKKQVFQTIDTLNLMGDIADLFTGKFAATELNFLDIVEEEETPEEKK